MRARPWSTAVCMIDRYPMHQWTPLPSTTPTVTPMTVWATSAPKEPSHLLQPLGSRYPWECLSPLYRPHITTTLDRYGCLLLVSHVAFIIVNSCFTRKSQKITAGWQGLTEFHVPHLFADKFTLVCLRREIFFSKVRFSSTFYRQNLAFPWKLSLNSYFLAPHNSTTDYVVFISGSEFGRSRRAELCQRKVSEWHIGISKPFGYLSVIHMLKTEFREGLCELPMGCHSFDILANCMLSYLIVLFVVSPSLSLVACHMAVRFSSLVSETNETITRISQWLMPLTCQPARQAR